jgi:hypothetical protein
MTGIQYLLSLHEVCCFQSQDRQCGKATNGELRRFMASKALHVNGRAIGPQDQIEFPITSVVLFPSSKNKRTTLL